MEEWIVGDVESWIEVDENSDVVEQLVKFLRFRAKPHKDSIWLKNEFGVIWGESTVFRLPGIKYELIEFMDNEDAYVVRYCVEK